MNSIFYSGLLAFSVSCVSMPLLVNLSQKIGAISELGGRHVGEKPIGRLGGVGIVFGILISIVLRICLNSDDNIFWNQYKLELLGLTLGLVPIAIAGFWDDISRLQALPKLFAQVLGATIAYGFGLKISGVDLPLIEPINLRWLSYPITVLWVVGIVNAINLIDGLDGLAGGVLLFASMVNLVAAIEVNGMLSAYLMVSMVGAVTGFMLYNWFPAKIYLGDFGAYSLGFILSVSGLLAPMQKVSTGVALLVPILSLGLPFVDTALVIVRRFAKQSGVFTPDRGHLHHALLDSGISHRSVVIGLHIISIFLCSISLLMVLKRNRYLGYVLLGASVAAIVWWGSGVKNELKKFMTRIRCFWKG